MSEKRKRLLFWHLVGIGAFNIVDYIFTLDFVNKGFYEANPIISNMIGTYEFPLVKLILVPLLFLFLWQHKGKIGNMITALTWIPFIGYFSLMVYFKIIDLTYFR